MRPARPTLLWQHDQQGVPRPEVCWARHRLLQAWRAGCAGSLSPQMYNTVMVFFLMRNAQAPSANVLQRYSQAGMALCTHVHAACRVERPVNLATAQCLVCPFQIAELLSAQRTTSPLSTVIRITSRSPASQPQSLRSLPAAALNSRCRFDLFTGGAAVPWEWVLHTLLPCTQCCLVQTWQGSDVLLHGAESVSKSAPSATPSAKCSASILRLSGVSFDLVWNQPVFYALGYSEMLFIVFSAWVFSGA